jgi:hypothetical protein
MLTLRVLPVRHSRTSIRHHYCKQLGDSCAFAVVASADRIEENLIYKLFNSSETRLARLLLLLANFGRDGNPQPSKVRISQETLAEMIGTTRSRVSFFMNKFRKLGFISYNGEIEVHNSLLDAVLHEKPQIQRD